MINTIDDVESHIRSAEQLVNYVSNQTTTYHSEQTQAIVESLKVYLELSQTHINIAHAIMKASEYPESMVKKNA